MATNDKLHMTSENFAKSLLLRASGRIFDGPFQNLVKKCSDPPVGPFQ